MKAVTEDLWLSMNYSVSSNKSLYNVNDLMREWIQKPGFPVVTVEVVPSNPHATKQYEGNWIKISQQKYQTISSTMMTTGETKDSSSGGGDGDNDDNSTIWKIPLNILKNKNNDIERFLFTKKEHYFYNNDTKHLPFDDHALMIMNYKRVGFYRVNYSVDLLRNLSRTIPTLTSADRLGLISDVVALSQAGICPITNFTEILLPKYQDEEELSVLQEIRDGISSLLKGKSKCISRVKLAFLLVSTALL
jgi:aminopeptidase N